MKHIRDPLYGYISVSDAELRVIGTPAVQRLRYIHQLGLSSAVYPGATHTRFEHSLGVMHLAGQMSESLGLSDAETRAYRLAGLLHDVGHAPFSHATERIMEERIGISHEEQSCRVVEGIANALGDEFPADPDLVTDAISGNSQYNIVAGDVDVDRMDYLRRDANATGIPHGEIDTETIVRFAETYEGDVVFSHKSLQAIKDLFHARNAMTTSVYAHHTSTIVEVMLQRAVEQFLDETGRDPEVLLRWDDRQLHTHLLDHTGVSDRLYTLSKDGGEWVAPVSAVASDSLYGRIATRNLYKRVYSVGVAELGRQNLQSLTASLGDVHELESELAERVGVDTRSVIIDPATPPNEKHPDVGISMGGVVQPFSDLSTLPDALEDSAWQAASLCVYAPEECRDDVAEEAENIFI